MSPRCRQPPHSPASRTPGSTDSPQPQQLRALRAWPAHCEGRKRGRIPAQAGAGPFLIAGVSLLNADRAPSVLPSGTGVHRVWNRRSLALEVIKWYFHSFWRIYAALLGVSLVLSEVFSYAETVFRFRLMQEGAALPAHMSPCALRETFRLTL